MKLREAVVKRLSKNPGEKLKAREIAEWIINSYPEACAQKAAKSGFETDTQLRNQLVAEIGSNRPAWSKKHPELKPLQKYLAYIFGPINPMSRPFWKRKPNKPRLKIKVTPSNESTPTSIRYTNLSSSFLSPSLAPLA